MSVSGISTGINPVQPDDDTNQETQQTTSQSFDTLNSMGNEAIQYAENTYGSGSGGSTMSPSSLPSYAMKV